MKVYVVTEYRIDYDDYPMGEGTVLKGFTDEVAAQIFAYGEDIGRKTRQISTITVDSAPSEFGSWKEYCDDKWGTLT